jgi:hypothetical protein
MQRTAFVIATIILLGVIANGQPPSTPDDGGVKDGVYSNKFFGFSVSYPADWVVHGADTNEHLMDVGRERATSSGALSSVAANVALKNTYQLLTTFRYALGTPGVETNSAFMIVAEKVSHAPGIVTGRDYLINVRPLMLKLGAKDLHEPVELVLSGHQFFRQDYLTPMEGVPIHQALIIGIFKGYALAFSLTGKDQKTVDEAAKALDTLKFSDSPPTAPAKPSVPKS